MKMKVRVSDAAAGMILAAFAFSSPSLVAQPAGVDEEIAQVLSSSKGKAKGQANAVPAENPRLRLGSDGFVRFLGSAPEHHFPSDAAIVPGKPEMTAHNFLKKHGKMLGAQSGAVDFSHERTRAKGNRRFVRFQQTYDGIPVFAAKINVQLDEEDGVESLLSDIQRDMSLLDEKRIATRPTITAAAARAAVLAEYRRLKVNAGIEVAEPQLSIFAPGVLGEPGSLHLAWATTAFSEQDFEVDHRVFVDAHSGEILRKYPLGCTARNRQVYDANNTTADPGTLRRSEGQAASGFADVDDAYRFLGDTYDYYFNNHARDSINGAGMTMSSTVRSCTATACPWSNAQYRSNNRMYFGDGFALDDVAGHELTHGVTAFESGLVYANASGAINESFSDIWGEFIDLGNGAGNDSAAVRWDIGEELPGGRLRSMSNPPAKNDPDRRFSSLYVPAVADPKTENDFGGVHSNSGVNNKLAFLLTDGQEFNGQTVYGIGSARVADLYYEVQKDILTSGADWQDLYEALRQAAVNLAWSTDDRNNLYRACLAVEIATGGRDVYVDGTTGCTWQTGAQTCGIITGPFHTVPTGQSGAAPGDTLYIHGGSYNQVLTLNKILTIRSYNGSAVIGQ